MLGAIIGDIAGSRFEWHNIKSKDFDLLTYRCHPTDDSNMTLAIAQAILASKGHSHGFDLTNESTAAGTTVNIWQYQDSNTTPIHRQWMLFPLAAPQQQNSIEETLMPSDVTATATSKKIYDLSGRRIDNRQSLSKGIYIVRGKKVVVSRQ